MGDRVLISVGAALNKTIRSTDIVGRLRDDEFTALMTSISKTEDARRKAQEELAVLYKKADSALYEAKRGGKNQFRLYQ